MVDPSLNKFLDFVVSFDLIGQNGIYVFFLCSSTV